MKNLKIHTLPRTLRSLSPNYSILLLVLITIFVLTIPLGSSKLYAQNVACELNFENCINPNAVCGVAFQTNCNIFLFDYFCGDIPRNDCYKEELGAQLRANPNARSLCASFKRGDANDDCNLDLTDPVAILAYLFLGKDAPECKDAADSNDDGNLDLADAVTVLNYLFLGQAPPSAPFPDAGNDTTPDRLDCCNQPDICLLGQAEDTRCQCGVDSQGNAIIINTADPAEEAQFCCFDVNGRRNKQEDICGPIAVYTKPEDNLPLVDGSPASLDTYYCIIEKEGEGAAAQYSGCEHKNLDRFENFIFETGNQINPMTYVRYNGDRPLNASYLIWEDKQGSASLVKYCDLSRVEAPEECSSEAIVATNDGKNPWIGGIEKIPHKEDPDNLGTVNIVWETADGKVQTCFIKIKDKVDGIDKFKVLGPNDCFSCFAGHPQGQLRCPDHYMTLFDPARPTPVATDEADFNNRFIEELDRTPVTDYGHIGFRLKGNSENYRFITCPLNVEIRSDNTYTASCELNSGVEVPGMDLPTPARFSKFDGFLFAAKTDGRTGLYPNYEIFYNNRNVKSPPLPIADTPQLVQTAEEILVDPARNERRVIEYGFAVLVDLTPDITDGRSKAVRLPLADDVVPYDKQNPVIYSLSSDDYLEANHPSLFYHSQDPTESCVFISKATAPIMGQSRREDRTSSVFFNKRHLCPFPVEGEIKYIGEEIGRLRAGVGLTGTKENGINACLTREETLEPPEGLLR